MTAMPENKIPYQADYWNDDGGRRWLRNLDWLEVMLAPLGEALLARAAARPGDVVLDVGCGGGKLAARLAAATGTGGSVLAVDVSSMLIERALRDYGMTPGLTFLLADAASAPLGNSRFTLVFSRFGVMFFADPVAAFTQLAHAMQVGGRMAFLCWQARDRNPWMYGPAAAAFEHVPAPPPPGPEDPGPFCFGDPDRVRRILAGAGLVNMEIEPLVGKLVMGTVDHALEFVSTMGPAAQPLAEAPAGARDRALAAMGAVLAAHDTPDGVQMPYATWLVTATKQ
jgi:SAM-dependent methyltransferase